MKATIDQNERLQIRLGRARNHAIKKREVRLGVNRKGETVVEDRFVCAKCKQAGQVLAVLTPSGAETTRCQPCLDGETILPYQWDESEELRAQLKAKEGR